MRAPAPSLQRGAHARSPAGRFQFRPLVGFGDSGGGQAHGGDAGAGGRVAGYGEGLSGERLQANLVAPAFKDAPLGLIDAAGVVGEDRLQGFGHALVGGAQRRQGCGFSGDDLRAGGRVMGGSPAAGFRGRFRRAKAAR